MDSNTITQLLDLNRRFYAQYGASFAATRRRIQEGVHRVLDTLPDFPGERWLDLGCGSGALAAEWLRTGRRSAYYGLDSSETLLAEASHATGGLPKVGTPPVTFARADLADPFWADVLKEVVPVRQAPFAGVLSFAVFHHLPSHELRLRVLSQVNRMLVPGGRFIHSEWQLQNSPKLMSRCLPWQTIGLSDDAVEPGDTLLDWRAMQVGAAASESAATEAVASEAVASEAVANEAAAEAETGEAEPTVPEPTAAAPQLAAQDVVPANLRYVHIFTRSELFALAAGAGFRVVDEFESDGHGGRLGLYQTWEKTRSI